MKDKPATDVPNVNNVASRIASLLVRASAKEGPTPHRDLLRVRLDYSPKSLRGVDSYLDVVRKKRLSKTDYRVIVLRCGAYCGEVIRRNGKGLVFWINWKTGRTIDPSVTSDISTEYYLYSPSVTTYPLGKVVKFLRNGREDSLLVYAKEALKMLAETSEDQVKRRRTSS